jgi:hypothetical protein
VRFEIGETLILSWLKHIKNCQITQLNWSPSNSFSINNIEDINKIIDSIQELLYEKHNISISLSNFHKEYIHQNYIGVVGLDIQEGAIENLYAVNSFYENTYSSDELYYTQFEILINQITRMALSIIGFFNIRKGNIILAAPKMHNEHAELLKSVMESLNTIFHSYNLKYQFSLYLNEDFEKWIFDPVCNNLNVGTNPSELFLDSIKLYNSIIKENSLMDYNASGITESNSEYQFEKIGSLVRREFGKLILEGKIDEEIIEQLTDSKFSKNTFNLNYAMLKKINDSQSLYVQRMVNGYGRYYSYKYEINGKKYLLCNDWYEKSRSKFLNWLEKQNT